MMEYDVHVNIFVIKKKKPLRTYFSTLFTFAGLAMLQNYRITVKTLA
jgi:hypothetical protein